MKTPLLLCALLSVATAGEDDDRGNVRYKPSSNTCGTDPRRIPSTDIGIRFNKISFAGAMPTEVSWPLMPKDFPLCPKTAKWLRKSKCWSVICQDDCPEVQDIRLENLIEKVGGLPTHPTTNSTSPYWDEVRELLVARRARLANQDPTVLLKRMPRVWANFTLGDIAEAVRKEYPGKHQADLIALLLKDGAQMDRTILPSKNEVDFIRYQVTLAELNTWSIAMIAPYNFGLKWYAGRARPEEIVWYIAKRPASELIASGVPADIVSEIHAMNLNSPMEFTAYPEGSPPHPAWPAMHSAASVVSFWLPVVMNLTKAQICEAKALDYGVAYGRTISGVHFTTDNSVGLNLGQELLVRKLPTLLKDRFGANADAVKKKMAIMRHDWTNYLKGDCFPSTIPG